MVSQRGASGFHPFFILVSVFPIFDHSFPVRPLFDRVQLRVHSAGAVAPEIRRNCRQDTGKRAEPEELRRAKAVLHVDGVRAPVYIKVQDALAVHAERAGGGQLYAAF